MNVREEKATRTSQGTLQTYEEVCEKDKNKDIFVQSTFDLPNLSMSTVTPFSRKLTCHKERLSSTKPIDIATGHGSMTSPNVTCVQT